MAIREIKAKRQEEQSAVTVRYFDYSLLAIIIFLMCFGLVMLYSSSSYDSLAEYGDGMYLFKRQASFAAVGIILMLVISRIDYHKYAKLSPLAFCAALLLMAMVRYSPFGVEVNGAKRWLKLPGMPQFQPSEIMKIAVILFIPYLICRMGGKVHKLKGSLIIFAWGAFAAYAVYRLTDNLSTAIIVLGIVCIILFVVHKKTKPFVILFLGGMAAALGGAFLLGQVAENSTDFRLQRIIAWMNPEKYASTDSFQTLQGLYAIGSGGFFGKGLGNGVQKTVIPEIQNDMILTSICEELGVFGAIIVLVLFVLLLYRLLFVAQNAPDIYGSLIVAGVMSHIAIQVILNVAVVTNMIPNTGITLPFISYGGTSLLFLMAEMGIVLGVSDRIRLEE